MKQIHENVDKRLLYNTKTVLFVIHNLFRLFLSFKNDFKNQSKKISAVSQKMEALKIISISA